MYKVVVKVRRQLIEGYAMDAIVTLRRTKCTYDQYQDTVKVLLMHGSKFPFLMHSLDDVHSCYINASYNLSNGFRTIWRILQTNVLQVKNIQSSYTQSMKVVLLKL